MTDVVDRFPAADFDHWAASYDQDVNGGAGFPFTGYADALQLVFDFAHVRPGMRVLDLGIGTGNLAHLFLQAGCDVSGVDYAPAMLEQTRLKLPGMPLIQADLRLPLPAALGQPFDRIVSGYTFHHFVLEEKVRILDGLKAWLNPSGRIVIADIAFADATALDAERQSAGDAWDEEEYWLIDASVPALQAAGWRVETRQVSSCAGVLCLETA